MMNDKNSNNSNLNVYEIITPETKKYQLYCRFVYIKLLGMINKF